MTHIGIVGAGLVGSLMANFLFKRGFQVTVFEKRNHPREQANYSGRSINLALSERGLKSLRALGLEEEVLKACMPMYGRGIHHLHGETELQPYGQANQHINAVSRRLLNLTLLDALPTEVPVRYEHRLIHWNGTTAKFQHSEGETSVEVDFLIGADGAFSETRKQLEHTTSSTEILSHQYQEYHFPSTKNGWVFENDRLHIWPRKEFMLIALPNTDQSFTGTLFLPKSGNGSFEELNNLQKMKEFFQQNFPDALDQLPDFEEQYEANPISDLMTIRVENWGNENALLIGDAAHAIVPFYGQGMNAGFEDCHLLDQLIDKLGITHAFENFYSERKADADAIADMALGNFIEMRDKVIDADFILQKKIEHYLHHAYPEHWIPQYSMVTFETEPYAKVLAKAAKQNQLMKELLLNEEVRKDWTSENSKEVIYDFLVKNAILRN